MPKIERIEPGTPAPAVPDIDQLAADLEAAHADVDRIRDAKQKIRAKIADLKAKEAAMAEDFAAAVDHLNACEKAHGRAARGGGPGRRVTVGAASDTEEVNDG